VRISHASIYGGYFGKKIFAIVLKMYEEMGLAWGTQLRIHNYVVLIADGASDRKIDKRQITMRSMTYSLLHPPNKFRHHLEIG